MFLERMRKIASELSYRAKENLPDSAFALVYIDPKTKEKIRKYPIHDRPHIRNAIARFAQWESEIPSDKRGEVARKIYNAAKAKGIEVDSDEILKYVNKSAEKLTYQEEQNLPDSVFAAVYKDPKTGKKERKYPVHDKEHVEAAIRYWPRFYTELPPSVRATAARKIYDAAKKFGVDVKEETILKYVGGINAKKAEQYIEYIKYFPSISNNTPLLYNLKLAERDLKSGDEEKIRKAADLITYVESISGVYDIPGKVGALGPDVYIYAGEISHLIFKEAEVDIDGVLTSVAEIRDVLKEEEDKLSQVLTSEAMAKLQSIATDQELQDFINSLGVDAREAIKEAIMHYRVLNVNTEV